MIGPGHTNWHSGLAHQAKSHASINPWLLHPGSSPPPAYLPECRSRLRAVGPEGPCRSRTRGAAAGAGARQGTRTPNRRCHRSTGMARRSLLPPDGSWGARTGSRRKGRTFKTYAGEELAEASVIFGTQTVLLLFKGSSNSAEHQHRLNK